MDHLAVLLWMVYVIKVLLVRCSQQLHLRIDQNLSGTGIALTEIIQQQGVSARLPQSNQWLRKNPIRIQKGRSHFGRVTAFNQPLDSSLRKEGQITGHRKPGCVRIGSKS